MSQPRTSDSSVPGALSIMPFGTSYFTCPDFPESCKEYPAPCRAEQASLRRLDQHYEDLDEESRRNQ